MKAIALGAASLLVGLVLTSGSSAHTITDNNMPKLKPTATSSVSSKVKPWCGRTTDRDYPGRGDRRDIKLILAYPSDGYDGSVASGIDPVKPYGQYLENTARRAEAYVAKATGNKKTLRIDRGTACSATSVDIATLRLDVDSTTLNNAYKARPQSIDRYLDAKVVEKMGTSNRIYAVFIDGIVGTSSWGWAAIGGDATIIIGEPLATNPIRYSHVFLHEAFHGLRAVNNRSPFSSPGWHCRQQYDLMCYDDHSVVGMPPLLPPSCSTYHYGVAAPDCGGEDYFNTRPTPGSWLASNPINNVYNDQTLMSCSERRSSCKTYKQPLMSRAR